MNKTLFKSLVFFGGLFAILWFVPQTVSAALTVGSTTITTDSTLGLQGGNVGIGNSAPTQELDVTGDALFSGNLGIAGTAVDANKYINLTKTIAPSATTYGLVSSLTSSTNSSVISAAPYVTLTAGSGTTSSAVGVQPIVTNSAAGTLSFGTAVDANTYSSGGATITTATGLSGQAAAFTGGNIGTAKAAYLHAQNLGTGTITTGYGLQIEVDNTNAAGTIGTVYGLALNNWSDAGTVTTSYGIYMDANIDIGTTRYALYSASTSDSYLKGDVGIGTNNPADQLHVNNSSLDENYIRVTNTASALNGFYFGLEQTDAILWNSEAGSMVFATGDAANMTLDELGNLAIGGTPSTSTKLTVYGDSIRIGSSQTPASAGAACEQGEIAWDTSFVYVCVAADTWKRSAITTW